MSEAKGAISGSEIEVFLTILVENANPFSFDIPFICV
jgi:hypothetical protein